ncbi:hypothetical protein [Cupriavidus pinatubonensis]|uniref:Transmembrane protein n=1 Tax=Cupriavidus pinatubonensis TaxID=248026 RepID=A0ABN7ZN49_9BURK|nr:hypothetical protein [Cupriavidus pinatubonensis]CAG9187374.1 hypothetical protein LMG23994_06819 [Cupriavidus pinatubonensis]
MELHMHSHHFARRMPDWRAAAIAGFAAGVVFLVVELIALWLMGQSPWGPLRMMAAIVMGRDVLSQAVPGASALLAALVVHFVLSILFGLILALIMAPFSFDSSIGMASLAGALFGVAVYVIDFYGMTRVFPWFAEARGSLSFLAHVVFGLVAADSYWKLERNEAGESGTGVNG